MQKSKLDFAFAFDEEPTMMIGFLFPGINQDDKPCMQEWSGRYAFSSDK